MGKLRLSIAVTALLVGVGLLGGMTAASAGATPATDTIAIFNAGSNPNQSGELFVVIDATSAVSAITAHLRTSASAPDSLTVSDFQLQSGTATNGVWAVKTPIPWGSGSGELPLGVYSVYVDASDAGGTSVSNVFAGTLDFLIYPSLTLTASPATVDYDHPDTTFSGQLTGTYPDGTTVKPLSGQKIDIVDYEGATFQVTTDASGDYSVRHRVYDTLYSATIPAADKTVNGPYGMGGPYFSLPTPPRCVFAHGWPGATSDTARPIPLPAPRATSRGRAGGR